VTDLVVPYFKVKQNNNNFEVESWVKLNGQNVPVTDNQVETSLVFLYNDNLYLWQKTEDVNLVDKFITKGKLSFKKDEWLEQLRKFILPLTKDYHVEFDQNIISEVREGDPEKRVVLQEKGDYLVFQPMFS